MRVITNIICSIIPVIMILGSGVLLAQGNPYPIKGAPDFGFVLAQLSVAFVAFLTLKRIWQKPYTEA